MGRSPTHIPAKIEGICGVDARYDESQKKVIACAVLIEKGRQSFSCYRGTFSFPYHTGLFYLHEGPAAVAAVRKLERMPSIVCFDAHGLAHPRSLGLATICGMILGIPSIGIAKSRLVGESQEYDPDVDKIVYKGRTVGFVTKFSGVKRYWSPGYSVSIKNLRKIIKMSSKACLESLEIADRVSKETDFE